MIQEFIQKTGEFNSIFGVYKFGNNPTQEQLQLRHKLLKEELEEYIIADNLVDEVDAICDMLYIACGTLYLLDYKGDLIYDISELDSENEAIYKICWHNDETLGSELNMTYSHLECIILYILDLAYDKKILYILPELFNEVHASNMSKLEDGKPLCREDGKILKGKNYFKPRLEEILIRNGKL